jgi:tetratricopeptide (TPR) repeat protein
MSILDGMPKTPAELEQATDYANAVATQFFAKAKFTEKQEEILDLVRRGIFFGEIMGITPEHKDAMLAEGIKLIQLGERKKARDVLLQLYIFDPLDARSIYAMATSYQLDGEFAGAAKLYVQYLALDATSPDGHLRLGECFLAAQEFDNAFSCFETAEELARRGHGNPGCAEHAAKMLSIVSAHRAAQPN